MASKHWYFIPKQPGGAPQKVDAELSHYHEPIDRSPDRLAGNTRRYGDADPSVQEGAVDIIRDEAKKQGLSAYETAQVLSIAKLESGFNPDAAPGSTSAAGLGQFINRTGASYGLNDSNRFDARANARALVEHYRDCRDRAARKGYEGRDLGRYTYKIYHDGQPDNEGIGLKLADQQVLPLADTIHFHLTYPPATLADGTKRFILPSGAHEYHLPDGRKMYMDRSDRGWVEVQDGYRVYVDEYGHVEEGDYKVKPGDTVYGIEDKFGVPRGGLEDLNLGIPDINKIYPGNKINLPPDQEAIDEYRKIRNHIDAMEEEHDENNTPPTRSSGRRAQQVHLHGR